MRGRELRRRDRRDAGRRPRVRRRRHRSHADRARVDEVVADCGVPHVLVNNAALDSPPDAPAEEVGPFEDYRRGAFDAVMDVNVKGTLLCLPGRRRAMAERAVARSSTSRPIYGMLSPRQELYEFRRARRRDVLQAGRLLGLEVRAFCNLTRYLATYWAKTACA